MKMLVSEFMQAYDLRGAVLEKAKKRNVDLELTVSSSTVQLAFSTNKAKKLMKICFLNIFEFDTDIPLGKIKENRIESITTEQLPTVHGVTEQLIRITVEAKDGLRAITFQSRRMEVEEAG